MSRIQTAEPVASLVTAFGDAVHALVGLRYEGHSDSATRRVRAGYRASVYTEMRTELEARQGIGGVFQPRSLPPVWIDGLDWLDEVDSTTKAWCPDGSGDTPARLDQLAAESYSPEDCDCLHDRIAILEGWRVRAVALLEPPRRWELVAACPACGVRTVSRRDHGGELVRQAALTVDADGCVCQACRTRWTPSHYRLLAAALGCALPEGVLE